MSGELIQYVSEVLAPDAGVAVDEDSRLIDTGIVDSMGLFQLISFVEERTGLRIPDGQVIPENFQRIRDIVRLVEKLSER